MPTIRLNFSAGPALTSCVLTFLTRTDTGSAVSFTGGVFVNTSGTTWEFTFTEPATGLNFSWVALATTVDGRTAPVSGTLAGTGYGPGSGDDCDSGEQVIEVGGEPYTTNGGGVVNRSMMQNGSSAFKYLITDAAGVAVDVSGRRFRFVVGDYDGLTQFLLDSADPPLADGSGIVKGDSANLVTVNVAESLTGEPYAGRYVLWDYTERDPAAVGGFTIKTAPISASE